MKTFKQTLIFTFAVFFLGGSVFAQNDKAKVPPKAPQAPQAPQETPKAAAPAPSPGANTSKPITAQSTPLELAQAAMAAHGGVKLAGLKSLVQKGSANVTAPNSTQTISAVFSLTIAGDKSRFELVNPFTPFLQIFDGEQLYSSMPQLQLPPMSRLMVTMIVNAGRDGYSVTALPDKKKRRGFKITSPDGFSTDFYINATTGKVEGLESEFTVRDSKVSTAIEIDKYRDIEGISLPDKFSQRIDFIGMSAYANYTTKEMLVNQQLAEDVFAFPQS
jgi:hypothetical protein